MFRRGDVSPLSLEVSTTASTAHARTRLAPFQSDVLPIAACSQGKKEVIGVSRVRQRLVMIECRKSVDYKVRITV